MHLFFVLVLEDLVGLHRTITSSFFGVSGWGIDLDYCGVEWFALEKNHDNFVLFGIAPKYCILDSFIDYEAFSISSKELLPTIVYVMVI